MRKTSGLFGALVLLLATTSCGGGGTGPAVVGGGGGGGGGGGVCPANTFCTTSGNTFSPSTRSVVVGTTVAWQNDLGLAHNVTWADAAGRNAALAGDGTGDIPDWSTGSRSRLFNAAGTYDFHCTIHPGMNGTLTVTTQ